VNRLVDQRQSQLLHGAEVPVEGGGDDRRPPRHLAQAEGAEALVREQPEGSVEKGAAGALLGLLAGGVALV